MPQRCGPRAQELRSERGCCAGNSRLDRSPALDTG
jgi:hypothetical protein